MRRPGGSAPGGPAATATTDDRYKWIALSNTLTSVLPASLYDGLHRHGVPAGVAHHVAALPPVSSLFSALLGTNPSVTC